MAAIQHFIEFSEFYRTLGFGRTVILPNFDILAFEESRSVRVPFMPPFRKNWYQVVFKLNPVKPVWLNTSSITPRNTLLLFNSPHHVYSWQLDSELRGFVLFFKPDFVSAIGSFEQEFPFFQLTESNLIEVTPDDLPAFDGYARQMLTVGKSSAQYKVQMLQTLLISFLYQCKSAYQSQQQANNRQSRAVTLVGRFRQLVATMYLEHRTVTAYATLLNITPGHLNEVVKATTGSTARHFIVQRLLTEARNLLRHTDLDINAIAYTLQFDEPTNFGKFFRNYAGMTPGQFREQGSQSG